MKIRLIGLFVVICSAFLMTGAVEAAEIDAGYDKGLYIKADDGKYQLKFNIQIQPQYQFLSLEGQGKTNTFQIRRGRLIFSGNAS